MCYDINYSPKEDEKMQKKGVVTLSVVFIFTLFLEIRLDLEIVGFRFKPGKVFSLPPLSTFLLDPGPAWIDPSTYVLPKACIFSN